MDAIQEQGMEQYFSGVIGCTIVAVHDDETSILLHLSDRHTIEFYVSEEGELCFHISMGSGH